MALRPLSSEVELYSNFSEAIDIILDDYGAKGPKRDLIRQNILSMIELQWRFNPSFRSDFLSVEDPVVRRSLIHNIIQEIAKEEVVNETKNTQAETEKLLMRRALQLDFFKKKPFREGVREVVKEFGFLFGDLGRNYERLSSVKLSEPDALRDVLLDAAFPHTKGTQGSLDVPTSKQVELLRGGTYRGFEEIISKAGNNDKEFLQDVGETLSDILYGENKISKISSYEFERQFKKVQELNQNYQKELNAIISQSRREEAEIRNLSISDAEKNSRIQALNRRTAEKKADLKGKYKPKFESAVSQLDSLRAFIETSDVISHSGKFFEPVTKKGERKYHQILPFAYKFDSGTSGNPDNLSITIEDNLTSFYNLKVQEFIASHHLTFVSRQVDRIRHAEGIVQFRELQIHAFNSQNYFRNANSRLPESLKSATQVYERLNIPSTLPQPSGFVPLSALQSQAAFIKNLSSAVSQIEVNVPNLVASQAFQDLDEFKNLASSVSSTPVATRDPVQIQRIKDISESIKSQITNNTIPLPTAERERFLNLIDQEDYTSLVLEFSTLNTALISKFGDEPSKDFADFYSLVTSFRNQGFTDTSQLSTVQKSRYDSLLAKVNTHLTTPRFSSSRVAVSSAISGTDLGNIQASFNSGIISGLYSSLGASAQSRTPNPLASQAFQDLDEFKNLVSSVSSTPVATRDPVQIQRIKDISESIKSQITNNTIPLPTAERERFLNLIDQEDYTSLVLEFSTLNTALISKFGDEPSKDFADFYSLVTSFRNQGFTDTSQLSTVQKSRYDSLLAKVNTHLTTPRFSSSRVAVSSAISGTDLGNIQASFNSGIISGLYSSLGASVQARAAVDDPFGLKFQLQSIDEILKTPSFSYRNFGFLKNNFGPLQELGQLQDKINERISLERQGTAVSARLDDEIRDLTRRVKSIVESGKILMSEDLKNSFLTIISESTSTSEQKLDSLKTLNVYFLIQYQGAPAQDLHLFNEFIKRQLDKNIISFDQLSDLDKEVYDDFKKRLKKYFEADAYSLGSNIPSNFISNLESGSDFTSLSGQITSEIFTNYFDSVKFFAGLGVLSRVYDLGELTDSVNKIISLMHKADRFSSLNRADQEELKKLIEDFKKILESEAVNLDVKSKHRFLELISEFRTQDPVFLNLRESFIEFQKVIMFEHLHRARIDIANKLGLSSDLTSLLERQRALNNALAVLNAMQSFKRLKGDELVEYVTFVSQLKKDLYLFGFSDEEEKKILQALDKNDYRTLKKYFSSGFFGNKKLDIFIEKLNTDLLKFAHQTGDKDLAKSLTAKNLMRQIMKSFIGRKYVSQAIIVAQMATDSKFMAKQVKLFLSNKLRNTSNNILRTLKNTFIRDARTRQFADRMIETFNNKEFIKNPFSYLWKASIAFFIEDKLSGYLSKRFGRFLNPKFFGYRYTLNPISLIKNPIGHISEVVSKAFRKRYKNFVYRRFILKYFRKTKILRTIRVSRARFWIFRRKVTAIINKIPEAAANYIGKAFIAIASKVAPKLALLLAGVGSGPVGWAIIALVAVIPILLKPFIGDVNYIEAIKRSLFVCCLLPFIIFGVIFMFLIAPILSLFSYNSIWSAVTSVVSDVFGWDPVEEVTNKTELFQADPLQTSNFSESTIGGYSGGIISNFLVLDGALNMGATFNNACATLNSNNEVVDFKNKGAYAGWMNIDIQGGELLTEADSELSFNILCNASYHLAQIFPGKISESSTSSNPVPMLNCHINKNFFYDGTRDTRYWCTKIVQDAYEGISVYNAKYNPRRIAGYYKSLTNLVKQGIYEEVLRLRYGSDGFSQCISNEILGNRINNYSGAIAIFNNGPTSACNDDVMERRENVDHVAVFLKANSTGLYFVQTNAGFLKDEAPGTLCDDGKSTKFKAWTATQKLCGLYYPVETPEAEYTLPRSDLSFSTSTADPYVNSINEEVCPIPAVNNLKFYRKP